MTPDPAAGNGNGGADWTATLPDDIKPVVQTKGWKSPVDVINSYRSLETTLGSKRFELPAPNWDEKKWGEFYSAAGRPETPDKYPNSEVKLPDSVKIDDGMLKSAKEQLHKLGLSTNQAKGALDFYYGFVAQQEQAATAARQKALDDANAALKATWGDKFEENTGFVKKAYEKFSTPEFEKELIDTGLGNNPKIIEMFAKIGRAMSEDSAQGRGGGNLNPQDAESAKAEISRLKMDAKFNEAYFNPAHADHKKVAAEWEELHKKAFGNAIVGQA